MSDLRFEDVTVRYGDGGTASPPSTGSASTCPPAGRRPGRRVGLRQVHARPGRGRPRAGRRAAASCSTARPVPLHGPAPRIQMVFQDPLLVARPADDASATRSPRRCRRARRRPSATREVARLPRARPPRSVPRRALPGAPLGRAAAARRHRARARRRAPRSLIADEITSALDVSIQGAMLNLSASCSASSACRSCSSPTTSPWCATWPATSRSCETGASSSPARRGSRRPPAPVHPRPARRHPRHPPPSQGDLMTTASPIDQAHWEPRLAELAEEARRAGRAARHPAVGDARAPDELVPSSHGVLSRHRPAPSRRLDLPDRLHHQGLDGDRGHAARRRGTADLDTPVVEVLPDLRLPDAEVTRTRHRPAPADPHERHRRRRVHRHRPRRRLPRELRRAAGGRSAEPPARRDVVLLQRRLLAARARSSSCSPARPGTPRCGSGCSRPWDSRTP